MSIATTPVCTKCYVHAYGDEPEMGDEHLTFATGTCGKCGANAIIWLASPEFGLSLSEWESLMYSSELSNG